MTTTNRNQLGFTIVELLIVIVVIGILAAITIVAYNGIQVRAKDTQRQGDIRTITQALEVYYIQNGQFPQSSGSTTINTAWSTTADSSWQNLINQLSSTVNSLPRDPVSSPGVSMASSSSVGFNYAYYSSSGYCGVPGRQMYILLYRFEGKSQTNTLQGDCSTGVLGPYSNASNYRVVK